MRFDLLQYLFSLGILYVYGRLLFHYGRALIHYMVNEQFALKIPLERPRMLFSLVGLCFMHLMLYAHIKGIISSDYYLFKSITLAAFGLAFFLSQIPWSNKFENEFQRKKLPPLPKNNNFKFRISDSQAQQLYNDLIRFDLLSQDKTSLQDLKKVLTEDWTSHSSRIYLNLDGPSCREFYDHLVKTFPSQSVTLKSFIETSGLIVSANGKPYKYNTIKNAPTRTPVSKQYEVLLGLFNKLG